MYCCPLSHTCKCTPVRYCWLLSHTAARLSCTTARGHILPITYWLIVTYYYCISSVSPSRLTDFQRKYSLYDAKRKTLDSVSKLFGIACKPFPELSKTGEVRVGECAFAAMICGSISKLAHIQRSNLLCCMVSCPHTYNAYWFSYCISSTSTMLYMYRVHIQFKRSNLIFC